MFHLIGRYNVLMHYQRDLIVDSLDKNIDDDEKRKFPRMPAQCPILYRYATTDSWFLGKLIDFSATGLSMITDQIVEENSAFEFQIQPGENKAVPEFWGKGIIKRCITKNHNQFHLSCQLTKIETPNK